ncbi:MAG: ClpXP protease specificity-enhancing factor [Pseudomonadota bacterium]
MTSTKPYFIRALHEWCSDEGLTPYLAVQVTPRTRVPREFVRDGQIVLNISLDATHQLQMGNDEISFQTRFNGASYPVLVHVADVVAIYAKENGQGMAFEADVAESVAEDTHPPGVDTMADAAPQAEPVDPDNRKASHLTRVK